MRFCAEPDPLRESCALLAALAPENPFHAYAYVKAMESLGYQPWVLSQCEQGRVLSACMAFMKSGHLNRSLEIRSLPCLPDSHLFWEGLLRFSREAAVSADAPVRSFLALIGSGAGELYQEVLLEDAVLSSVFVLRAKRGAYVYSAGTSPDGMALGASESSERRE